MSVPSHLIPPQTASPGLHVDSPDLATQPLKCLMQALWTSLAWQSLCTDLPDLATQLLKCLMPALWISLAW